MKIMEEDLEKVALSSRLDLTEEDKADYIKSLNEILDFLDILNNVDTGAVEPALHVLGLKNVFREDKLMESLDAKLVFDNAPEEEDGAFKVPRIV